MSRCPFAKPSDAPAGLLTEDALREPYAIYKRLRKEQPVAYISEQNFWLITRYDDCEYVLAHPEKFSSREAVSSTTADPAFTGGGRDSQPVERTSARQDTDYGGSAGAHPLSRYPSACQPHP